MSYRFRANNSLNRLLYANIEAFDAIASTQFINLLYMSLAITSSGHKTQISVCCFTTINMSKKISMFVNSTVLHEVALLVTK
jgi:hypothetical protein